MIDLRWLLVPAMFAALSACGGGGSPSATPPVSNAPQSSGPKGAAQVTLRFPPTFAIAKSAKSTQSKSAASTRRGPAYINPTIGYTLTVSINGQTIEDPSTGFTYFTINATNPDGSANITVPISSNGGTAYPTGALCFTEWDGSNGTGNLVASGCNQAYTDSNGNPQPGTFTITPGTTTAIVLTMLMNATQIAITTDPIAGSDATTNSAGVFCTVPGVVVYAFAADPSAGYVLPGASAGYPGIPTVSLSSQSTDILNNSPPNTGKLSAAGLGWIFESDGNNGVSATFTEVNPSTGLAVNSTFTIEPESQCG
jgi:hypothetical protein